MTGPANVPVPSSVLEATFVATSSVGVRARRGTRAIVAGRTGATATDASAARAKTTTRGLDCWRAKPIAPRLTARAR